MSLEETLSTIQRDISEVKSNVAVIKALLKGYNGEDNGLIDEVSRLKKDFYNFRKWVLLLIAFLVGAEVLSALDVINIVRGGL